MARGVTFHTDDGAPNGSSASVKVKSEKIKAEKKNKGKQRAYVEEEEEEDDEEQGPHATGKYYEDDEEPDAQGETDEEDEEGAGSPRGAKRSRVNEDGDSRPADKAKYKERVKTLPRDVDG
jgi:hypothetical protein